jgi:hypothetical protein
LQEVQDLAAKPAPEGFRLRIHKTTLVRFHRERTRASATPSAWPNRRIQRFSCARGR